MKKLLSISVFVALAVSAAAQGVNSTVSVTNDYRSHAADVNKQTMEMLVPDSLLHFDYKFDYSVFESPYKGAYEFSPYSIKVTPEASGYNARKLYEKHRKALTRPCSDEEFMALYEDHPEMEETDDAFVEEEPIITTAINEYVKNNKDIFLAGL